MKKLRMNFKKILLLVSGASLLSVLNFNCAPPSFQVNDSQNLKLSSSNDELFFEESFDTKIARPEALLTGPQILDSMLNITGQKTIDQTQIDEFNRRQGSLPEQNQVDLVNSPMLLSLTSLAGTVCSSLVAKEEAQPMANRKFFKVVNFASPIASLSASDYGAVVNSLSSSFLGRAPSSVEVAAYQDFRTEFMAAVPAAEMANAKHIRNLMISTCAAASSSFDIFTY